MGCQKLLNRSAFATVLLLIAGCESSRTGDTDAGSKPVHEVADASSTERGDAGRDDPGVSAHAVKIGPMGGEVLWDNGLTLRVPEGAVTEEVSFSAVLHTTSAEADWVLLHVDLEPSDIWFDKPVVLSVAPSVLRRAPRDPSAIFVVSTLPDDAVAPDSSDAEVTEPEPVISTLTPEGDIQMELWHMSPKVVAECPLEPDAKNDLQKLKKLPKVRDVATGCTRALSAQIQAAYASYTGLLVSVEKSEPNLIVTDPLRGHLHPEVAEALEAAAKKTKSKIQLNYAFRALPVQYLLKPTCYDKCDAREDQDCTSCKSDAGVSPDETLAAARIGASAHGIGYAIDISAKYRMEGEKGCLQRLAQLKRENISSPVDIRDALFPEIGKALAESGFEWWGLTHEPCKDVWHFQYGGYGQTDKNLLNAHINVFDYLWNNSFPCHNHYSGGIELTKDSRRFTLLAPQVAITKDTVQELALTPVAGFKPDRLAWVDNGDGRNVAPFDSATFGADNGCSPPEVYCCRAAGSTWVYTCSETPACQ